MHSLARSVQIKESRVSYRETVAKMGIHLANMSFTETLSQKEKKAYS